MAIELDKWTMAYDGGWRRGMTTTNNSECVNNSLRDARKLPICGMIQKVHDTLINYWISHSQQARARMNNDMEWTQWVQEKFETSQRKSASNFGHIINMEDMEAEVCDIYTRRGSGVEIVSVKNRKCTCGAMWQRGVPCEHMMTACRLFGVTAKNLVPSFYKTSAFVATYSQPFHGIPNERTWPDPDFRLVHNTTLKANLKKRAAKNEALSKRNG